MDGGGIIRDAPGHLGRADIGQVKFACADYHDTLQRYPIDAMKEGWNTMPDGEKIFYIRTPASGPGSTRAKLTDATGTQP